MSAEERDSYVASSLPFNGMDRALLARLDERTHAIALKLEGFVTKESFRPVMWISYGMMASLGLTLLGALLKTVLK